MRGDVRHRAYQEWLASHWDWGWLELDHNISPSDMDFIIERHNHFFIVECKPPQAVLSKGQRDFLTALSFSQRIRLYIVWGINGRLGAEPQILQHVTWGQWGPIKATSRAEFKALVHGWMLEIEMKTKETGS